MAFGSFTLEIDGERQDGTAETKARLYLKPQGVDVLINTAGDEFRFPTQFANPAGVPISLPYSLALDSNSTTGDSTTIGYEGWLATDYGRIDFQFAAPPMGSTLDLTDVVDTVVTPVSDLQLWRDETLEARDEVLALQGTFVRFTDLAGNPIPAHTVTIKVNTTTGEIDDITYQGA